MSGWLGRPRHYAEQWEVAALKQQLDELRAQVTALKTYLGVVNNLNDRYVMVPKARKR